MNLDQAKQAMSEGAKVKLPEWTGYWFMNKGIINVLTRTGDILDTPWVDKYRDRDDFEVISGSLGFDFALHCLFSGKRVRRKSWAEGVYLALQTPDKSSKMTLPYIYVKTKTGDLMPWTPRTIDILANDWEVDGRAVVNENVDIEEAP